VRLPASTRLFVRSVALASLSVLAACKGPLQLTATLTEGPTEVNVVVHTSAGATIKLGAQERVAKTDPELFSVPYDQASRAGSRTILRIEAVRERESKVVVLYIEEHSVASRPSAPLGKWDVSLDSAPSGRYLKIRGPFASEMSLSGEPVKLTFSVAANSQLRIGGAPIPVESGKVNYTLSLEQILTTAPLGGLFPAMYSRAQATLPVQVITPDGQTHDEALALEYANSQSLGAEAQRLFDPVRKGQPVDLGPSPAGGYVVMAVGYSGEIRPHATAATLKDATIAVWQTSLPSTTQGTCSYSVRGRHVSAPAVYSPIELAAYDLRKGKLLRKQVVHATGSRCPTVITTFGGAVSHSPTQAQLDAALAKLTR